MDLATREDVVLVVHLRPKPIGKVIRVIYELLKIRMIVLVFVRPDLVDDLKSSTRGPGGDWTMVLDPNERKWSTWSRVYMN